MGYGFVKAAALAPKIRVADTGHNAQEIIRLMKEAWEKGARILVFPELCLTGYTCGELFLQELLLRKAKEALLAVIEASEGMDGLFFVGVPLEVKGKLYNVAAGFSDGRLLGLVPKTCIPNYSEFYEARYFTKAPEEYTFIDWQGFKVPFGANILFSCRNMPGLLTAAEICEDVWAPEPPGVRHALHGATVIVNLSASDDHGQGVLPKGSDPDPVRKAGVRLCLCQRRRGGVFYGSGIRRASSDLRKRKSAEGIPPFSE